MKLYRMPNGRIYKWNDGEQPSEAVEVNATPKRAAKPATKKRTAANKSRKVADK